MKKVDVLRKKYPKFVYEGYSCEIFKNDLKIFFDFKIAPDIEFKPEIVIKNIDRQNLSIISDKLLDNLVFHLGLMEIPSYWKATCSPEIEIRAGYLNKDQIKWWKDLIINGMGQFFYENKINFTKSDFVRISSNRPRVRVTKTHLSPLAKNGFLIPMGEGKDSITTLELLKKFEKISKRRKTQINCFIVNPKKEHFKILEIAGIYPVKSSEAGISPKAELFNRVKNPVIVERKVDPVLLELNRKGFLNGHTPITALISNLAVFCGVLFGYKNIIMSCEKSANEGNIKYLNKIINHQWSKSFEFEEKFRYYSKKYLAKEVEYFSFLRPLYEIQIAKLFSKLTKYFQVFLSCNEAYKTASGTKKPTGKWCGKCSKCLFVFVILYPFVEKKKLIKIFGKDLFEDKRLIPIMKELIGEDKYKPFECVGTKKETLIAFYLSYKKYIDRKRVDDTYVNLPFLLRYFEKKILPKYSKLKLEKESKKILNSWDKQNNLPKEFDKALKKLYFK